MPKIQQPNGPANTAQTIVKVVRNIRTHNVFEISNRERTRHQIAYGLKVEGANEGRLRRGLPAYFYAEWHAIRWVLGKEAPVQDW